MMDEYRFDIDGVVIVLRPVEYVEKARDSKILASRTWPGEIDPMCYRAWCLTQEGTEHSLGTATQYVRNTMAPP